MTYMNKESALQIEAEAIWPTIGGRYFKFIIVNELILLTLISAKLVPMVSVVFR